MLCLASPLLTDPVVRPLPLHSFPTNLPIVSACLPDTDLPLHIGIQSLLLCWQCFCQSPATGSARRPAARRATAWVLRPTYHARLGSMSRMGSLSQTAGVVEAQVRAQATSQGARLPSRGAYFMQRSSGRNQSFHFSCTSCNPRLYGPSRPLFFGLVTALPPAPPKVRLLYLQIVTCWNDFMPT